MDASSGLKVVATLGKYQVLVVSDSDEKDRLYFASERGKTKLEVLLVVEVDKSNAYIFDNLMTSRGITNKVVNFTIVGSRYYILSLRKDFKPEFVYMLEGEDGKESLLKWELFSVNTEKFMEKKRMELKMILENKELVEKQKEMEGVIMKLSEEIKERSRKMEDMELVMEEALKNNKGKTKKELEFMLASYLPSEKEVINPKKLEAVLETIHPLVIEGKKYHIVSVRCARSLQIRKWELEAKYLVKKTVEECRVDFFPGVYFGTVKSFEILCLTRDDLRKNLEKLICMEDSAYFDFRNIGKMSFSYFRSLIICKKLKDLRVQGSLFRTNGRNVRGDEGRVEREKIRETRINEERRKEQKRIEEEEKMEMEWRRKEEKKKREWRIKEEERKKREWRMKRKKEEERKKEMDELKREEEEFSRMRASIMERKKKLEDLSEKKYIQDRENYGGSKKNNRRRYDYYDEEY